MGSSTTSRTGTLVAARDLVMSVVRNVGLLTGASAVRQAISLAAAPVIARLFLPAEFGVAGVFFAFAGVLGVVACLRLDLAVVVPEGDDEASDVLFTAVVATALLVAITAVLMASFGGGIARALGEPDVAILLPYLPLYLGTLGAYQALEYWATRFERFGRVASADLVRAAGTAGAQVAFGFARLASFGLVLGQVLGQVLGLVMLFAATARRTSTLTRRRRSWPSVARVVGKYRKFVVFGSSQALVNSVNQGMPAVVLTATFDASVAGLYLMAQRLVAAPVGLVGRSVRKVIYPRLGRALHERTLFPLATRATAWLAALAVVPTVLAVWLAPPAFVWLLGEEWRTAGEFSRYLVAWLAVAFVNIPSVSVVPLLEMQRWHAGYEVVYLLFRAAALVAGARTGDPTVAIALFSGVGVLFNLILIVVPLNRAWVLTHGPRHRHGVTSEVGD
jgi:lipopolysaccharide exporter